MKNCGFVYVATGKKYVKEASASAMSVRKHMPDVSICLFTDADKDSIDCSLFDIVKEIPSEKRHYSVRDKIWPLTQVPYEHCIFLDTDTEIVRSIAEIFESLERYDVMVAHDPNRAWYPAKCPKCIQEINTGLIAYKKNKKTIALFDRWSEIYKEQIEGNFQEGVDLCPPHDQPAFKEALYELKLDSYILTPEYNVRTIFPMYLGKGLSPAVLHGRDLEQKFYKICKEHEESAVVFPSLHLFNSRQCVIIGNSGSAFIKLCEVIKFVFMSAMRVKRIFQKP